MNAHDLSYRITGGFVRFVANTTPGEAAWRELAKHSDGSAAFPAHQATAVLAQLRAAGYTVAKVRREQRNLRNWVDSLTASDLALLDSLQ